jgi:hypothetical protein
MYSEFSGDPVIQSLAFEDQRHYVVLLCLKCNGTLDRNVSVGRKEVIVLRGLGLDQTTATEVKRRLMEVSLIDKNWQPLGWENRQFKSDLSTIRVRKYRKNKDTGNVSETENETESKSFRNGPEQNRTEQNRNNNIVEQVRLVFEHWQKVMNHPRAKLTPERQRKIERSLKNYDAASLCKAIDGCSKTPHNMGKNDRSEVYDDIELILRDASHIERFMRNAANVPRQSEFLGAV